LTTFKYVREECRAMTGRFATVLVVALVVLAGCSGGPATSSTVGESDETTPDAGESGEATTAANDGGDRNRVTVPSELRPPGANARGITAPRTLLRGHLSAMRNVSTESTVSFTSLSGNATPTVEYDVSRTADGDYVSSRRTVGNGTPVGEDVYVTGEVVTVQSVGANETTYKYAKGPTRTRLQYGEPSNPLPSVALLYFSVSSGMKATDFATVNGQKTVRYDEAGVNQSQFRQFRSALGVPNGTVTDFSFTAYVSANGVLQDAEATLDVETGAGEVRSFTLDHRVESYGDAVVSEPSWVTGVPQLNGSVVRNGTAVRLENDGERTLFEHTVGVQGNVTSSVDVNESIAPGDARYLYVTGSGNDTTLQVTDDASTVPSDARYLLQRTAVSVFVGSENVSISLGLFRESRTTNESVVATDGSPGPSDRASTLNGDARLTAVPSRVTPAALASKPPTDAVRART
jgi:hypothetical protein